MIRFDTHPERYNHWKLGFDGPVATLTLDIAEDKGIAPGYKLKLNSYDLGVDIELHDALNRIRFEHPEVKSVVITSGKEPHVLLGRQHLHARPVDARLEGQLLQVHQRDAERPGGFQPPLGPEVPRRAERHHRRRRLRTRARLRRDRHDRRPLLHREPPEVPLLGVLPGTGGLTRIVDKRKVRRDLADVFCTTAEGVRADRAKEWKLVDHSAKPQQFAEFVKQRALELAQTSYRPGGEGIVLTPLAQKLVSLKINKEQRTAELTVSGSDKGSGSPSKERCLVSAAAGARAGRRDPQPAPQLPRRGTVDPEDAGEKSRTPCPWIPFCRRT
jgi:benzoyl-CoA-dihydrodiol lyase